MSDERPRPAVISDFGGVLTTPLWGAFAAVQAHHGIPPESIGAAITTLTEARGENPLYVLERGEMSEARFMADLGAGVSEVVGRHVDLSTFAERYFEALEPNFALLERLGEVRVAGHPMALLTNNVREWEPRWRSMLPVDDLFDVVVDSAFVGLRKPDPRIYELTCQRLGVPAEDCVFLDDFAVNCEAAAALGMRAIRVEDTDAAIAALDAALVGDAPA